MKQEILKKQLARQLGFIERSCKLFDEGIYDEAIRMATAIRVLIHQTRSSNSLLELLGVRSTIKLISSIRNSIPTDGVWYLFDGVTTLTTNGPEPNLDFSYTKAVDVSTWWEETTVIIESQVAHTRKSIVLAAANKDGGTHVDKELTPEYKKLQEGLYYFTKNKVRGDYTKVIPDHQFFALRVFAHELLRSQELQELASDSTPLTC